MPRWMPQPTAPSDSAAPSLCGDGGEVQGSAFMASDLLSCHSIHRVSLCPFQNMMMRVDCAAISSDAIMRSSWYFVLLPFGCSCQRSLDLGLTCPLAPEALEGNPVRSDGQNVGDACSSCVAGRMESGKGLCAPCSPAPFGDPDAAGVMRPFPCSGEAHPEKGPMWRSF
eukprot:CAMPEP_0174343152 /NCGR_PEP_ID=MMETSP0810-20121108/26725_1 /TAXON_ID=73025 ORGANISM="Eutreptiella gymnastica-like, Strain CCMP1594" /NCGR_SAMPLE_ID=MMETSP0810 /ASSEMBLY_ACC=CAM_ASM_000659 /LENGTH=168 /DNA_ID=CAMNT_0015465701 /DNA_START=227 /DNA_END=733 /DNA_ORIENTATION=-